MNVTDLNQLIQLAMCDSCARAVAVDIVRQFHQQVGDVADGVGERAERVADGLSEVSWVTGYGCGDCSLESIASVLRAHLDVTHQGNVGPAAGSRSVVTS